MRRWAAVVGLALATLAVPAYADAQRQTPITSFRCKSTLVAPDRSLTAMHCMTGVRSLKLSEVKSDWVVIKTPNRHGDPVPVQAMTYIQIAKAVSNGANLRIAGQDGCQVRWPFAVEFFTSDCKVKRGDSGGAVLLDDILIGIVSGYHADGSAIIVSASQFPTVGK